MTMRTGDVQMIADRWMMLSRRLVNWGSYAGYHEFRPSTDGEMPVTLLAGASESGKSTLVDAQISLLYPTGTPFNKASNSGRSERSDYTYLRGMVGVGDGAGGDEPIYLRGRDGDGAPQSVWGAIVDTYRDQTTGQVLSCGKFLYLMPGDGRGDVRRQYVAWDRPIDPRLMDRHREAPFTAAQLHDAYPDCLTFSSAEAFHAHIWGVMGLSEAACRLLHKIQSADAPSRLDDIFKQGVLGVPGALDLAQQTVEDYDRYDGNFRAIEEKTRRMDALRGIRDAYDDYNRARSRTTAFDAIDPARPGGRETIRVWAEARMASEVAAQRPVDEQAARAHADDELAAGRRSQELRSRIDAIRGMMQGLDGGEHARLEHELDAAQRALERVEQTRERASRRFEAAGEAFPADERAWDGRRLEAVNFKRGYDERAARIEHDRDEALMTRSQAQAALERLEADYDRQKSQRTRITRQMDEARAMLCRATGLTADQLPYAAELMDVREDEERWRLAMNVAYAPIARTILVDGRLEAGFAAKVSAIDPHAMARRTWRFVDVAHPYDGDDERDPRGDGAWLSSKLRYREDSPFAGWLRAQTRSDRLDAMCVDAIDDADRRVRQVQADGQIKSGDIGQHGVKDRQEVIGYVNEAYLSEIQRRIDEARERCDEAERACRQARERGERLQGERELADLLAYTKWESVDVDAARREVAGLKTTIASLGDDPKLGRLAAQRDELSGELERCEQRRLEAKQAAQAARRAAETAGEWLAAHASGGTGGESAYDASDDAGHADAAAAGENGAAPGQAPRVARGLDADAAETLSEAYESQLSGLGDPALRAHMIIGAGFAASQAAGTSFPERVVAGMAKETANRIAAIAARVRAAKEVVESRMRSYIDVYAAHDDALTADVEDWRYYLDELEGLGRLAAVETTEGEYRRCLEQLYRGFLTVKHAIDTDADDIHDQLDRINAMLKGQQFGPAQGSLSLHADVGRPERAFLAQLRRVIGLLRDWRESGMGGASGATAAMPGPADGDGLHAARKAFADCRAMVDLLRAELTQVRDTNGVKRYGARDLDPRCRSTFYAIVSHEHGPDERITSTGGRSGGALQELTSFVYGAALIYLLGGGMTSEPSYTTLFLDEALIKADGRYTQRALAVLPRLGFQVIVSAPESKTGEILGVSTKAYVTYKDPETGLTSLREAVLDRSDDGADGTDGIDAADIDDGV